MCGFVGAVWNRPHLAISEQTLHSMNGMLSHRGPDGEGFYTSTQRQPDSTTQAALGHRRLSIIDVAGGAQPLCNEDGTIWIAFNGEIYNYRELQQELISRGHRFSTHSDTEVIIHLYEEFGPRCVDRLRGMFAFAIYDERRQRFVVARDRLGKKPVFYQATPGRMLVASELKSILQVPGLKTEVDPRALDLYLTYQYVPHPYSILEGFQKLPPAHVAVWENDQLTIERYWEAPYAETPPEWSADRWKKELRETLTEAVRLRMRSDVPVGAFLSGGIDSTITAGLMQSLSEQKIHTFSMGFPVAEYDERKYARIAANHLQTEHHEFVVEPNVLEMLPHLVWQYDEPFSDSSAIPTMALSEATRRFVKVSLSGDGGDELFAGYQRYQAVALAGHSDRLPSPIKKLLGLSLWQRIPTSTKQRSPGRRIKRFLEAIGQTPQRRYLRWIGIFDADLRNQLFTPEYQKRLQGLDSGQFLEDFYQICPNRDFVTQTTCVDLNSYLPCDILTKVDIATMAYGLEARSPFIDQQVVELAARMPIELKLQPGQGKKILIETFSDLIPQEIKTRPKMGFGVPIDHWLRKEFRGLLTGLLLSERALERGIFQRQAVQRLIDDHLNHRWDHAYRLWNLLCLEVWHRIYVDQNVSSHPPTSLSEFLDV